MKLEEYRIDNSSKNNIKQSIDLGDIKIVLLDISDIPPSRKGQKNLLAIDKLNIVIWVADLPFDLYASYWTIEIRNNDLCALCGSFLCQIDTHSGKIISEQFVK